MPEPISPRLLQAVQSFQRKYADPRLRGLPPPLLGPLVEIDANRVRRGQFPLSSDQTVLAARAMADRQTQPTPAPESGGVGGFFGNVFEDARHLLMGIPKLPGLLVQEARELPQISERLKEAQQGADSPIEKLAAIAEVPGIRMLPGAFVVSNLDEPSQLLKHPLFTALDVAPYAAGAIKGTSMYARAVEEATAAGRRVPKPLPTFFKTVGGPPTRAVSKAVFGRTPGEILDRMGIGPTNRAIAETQAQELRGGVIEPMQEFANKVREKITDAGVTDDRIPELTRIMNRGDPDEIGKLAPHEREVVDYYDTERAKLDRAYQDSALLLEYKGHLYPAPTVEKFLSLERQIREGDKSLSGLAKQAQRLRELAPDIVAGEEAAGLLDTTRISQVADDLRRHIADQGDDFRRIVGSAPDSRDTIFLKKFVGRVWQSANAPIRAAVKAIDAGDYAKAANHVRKAADMIDNVKGRIRWSRLSEADVYRQWADDLERQGQLLTDVGKGDRAQKAVGRIMYEVGRIEAKQADLTKTLKRSYKQTVPREFVPLVREQFHARARKLALARNPGEIEEALLESIDRGLYERAGLSQDDLTALWREVAPTWLEFKAKGFKPRYVRATDIGEVAQLRFPRIYPEKVMTPKAVKDVAFDASPGISNFAVALEREALEWLSYNANDRVVGNIIERYGRSTEAMYNAYEKATVAQMAHLPPGTEFRTVAQSLWERDGWILWRPTEIVPWRRPRATLAAAERDVWVPASVSKTLQQMFPEGSQNLLKGVLEKATGLFKLAILPFSPRWHLYNTIGGGIMVGTRTGPSVLSHWKAAIQMMRDGTLPVEIARGMGSVPLEDAYWAYAAGGTMARWLQESMAGRITSKGEKVGKAVGTAVQKSFDLNETVDLFYRSVSYLYGKTKAERAGLSPEVARAEGIHMANTVLQNWDRMTPFERQVMRTIFPFYGWMRHILGYTMTLPMDHPLRMSIISNFVRNEWTDYGEGLPERFFTMFFLGEPDEFGNIKAVNFRGSNPFSDVANYMTLAGFISQLNPAFSGVLEAMGVNTASGKADLYPDLTYDPVTGRTVPKTPSVARTVLTSLVPQGEAISSLFGFPSDEMRSLKMNNPDAYRQRILSTLGAPPIPQEVNLAREAALAELSRDKAAQTAFTAALKSGDWGDAMRYESLRPLLRVIAGLQETGQLQQYELPEPVKVQE